jgi:hypothetical protein
MDDPAGRDHWPRELLPVFERFLVCEYASLSRQGAPITYPVTPYVGEDGRTLDVSCGLTSPAKAERARRNPEIALLFSGPTGSGLDAPPVVLVQGKATVRDRDLQANTDRYVRLQLAKYPDPWRGTPHWFMRRQDWYWARIWILVTPLRITWWPQGCLDQPPETWSAPADTVVPASDPAPAGAQPPAWRDPDPSWPDRLAWAVRDLGRPILTVVDAEGLPVPFRVRAHYPVEGGSVRLELPAGRPVDVTGGPACLTFHQHESRFRAYENAVFVGRVDTTGDAATFVAERALPDISLMGSRWRRARDFLSARREIKGRVVAEAARRDQPPPRVRIP